MTGNDASAFSIPEEIDYSVPFDFLSFAEGDNIAHSSLNDNKSISPKIDGTYFAGRVDTDIFLERENKQLKNKDHIDYKYDKDLKIENVMSKLI